MFNRFYRLEIYSLIGWFFWPGLWTVAPMDIGTYSCTVAPLSSLWPIPPLPKLNVQYIQAVCVWRGGGELYCRPYSVRILHSVSDQIQNLLNCFTTPNKMTSEDDIKGLVSLKFLRPCYKPTKNFKSNWSMRNKSHGREKFVKYQGLNTVIIKK